MKERKEDREVKKKENIKKTKSHKKKSEWLRIENC